MRLRSYECEVTNVFVFFVEAGELREFHTFYLCVCDITPLQVTVRLCVCVVRCVCGQARGWHTCFACLPQVSFFLTLVQDAVIASSSMDSRMLTMSFLPVVAL